MPFDSKFAELVTAVLIKNVCVCVLMPVSTLCVSVCVCMYVCVWAHVHVLCM